MVQVKLLITLLEGVSLSLATPRLCGVAGTVMYVLSKHSMYVGERSVKYPLYSNSKERVLLMKASDLFKGLVVVEPVPP